MKGLKFIIVAILLSIVLISFLFPKEELKKPNLPIQILIRSLPAQPNELKKLRLTKLIKPKLTIDLIIPQKPKKIDELSDSIEKLSLEIEALEKTKPDMPRKETRGRHFFDIKVDTREFPRFFCLDEILFELDESRSSFPDSLYHKAWDDVKLRRGNMRDDYILTLIKNGEETNLFVYPVYQEKAFGSVMKTFERKVAIYQAKLFILLMRKENFEKEYRSLLAKWKKELTKIQEKVNRKGREI